VPQIPLCISDSKFFPLLLIYIWAMVHIFLICIADCWWSCNFLFFASSLCHWLCFQAHSAHEGKPWLGLSNLHFVLYGLLWWQLALLWWMLVSRFDRKHLKGGLYFVLQVVTP
jgi:hypothetical protein